MKKYYFREIKQCEMCSEVTDSHKILGQRLNRSQGFNPRKKTGITVTIRKCGNCGLIYSDPQPIPFDIQDHYGTPPEEYWKKEYFIVEPAYFKEQIDTVQGLLNFRAGMKALDIGAGLGKAMLAMEKAGFDVYGLEPSVPFYERAISQMNVKEEKLKLGAIEEVEYEEEMFDFISFGAVFEHLYSPAECLEKALRWLKPEGIIHIEVPSSKWLIAKFMNFYFKIIGTNYVTNLSPMHPPFHLYEFHRKSFEKLSERLNFAIVKVVYYAGPIYFVPGFLHPVLKKYMDWTNTGMQMAVYLRKRK